MLQSNATKKITSILRNLRYHPVMEFNTKGYPGLYRECSGKRRNRYRILISHNKKQYQESFYFDNRESDEIKARQAAITRWAQLRERFPVLDKRKFREVVRRPSGSGLSGVRLLSKTVNKKKYEFWTATWTDLDGTRTTRSFSVNKYGEKEAKKLAIEVREVALNEIAAH